MKFLIFMLLWSCSKSEIPVTSNVTFTKDIKPITDSICVKCHYEGSKDFRLYENAYPERHEMYRRVYIERNMPAQGTLTDQQRALFRDWVNQGAKQ